MKIPLIVQKIFGSITWRMPGIDPVLFLTFDDGPNPDVTPAILDILKSFHAKATFFCVGENIMRYPDVYMQTIAAGHTIGNHTYHHLNGWKTKTNAYLRDVEQCRQMIAADKNLKHEMQSSKLLIGENKQRPAELFRPPYGKLTPAQYMKLKSDYNIVMWDVISGDYDKNLSVEKCVTNVCDAAQPGSIVVFHDSSKAKERVLYSLPRVLEHFSKRNFLFRALSVDLLTS